MARQQKVQQEAVPKPFPLGPELEEGQRDPPEGGNMPLDNQGRDRNGRGDSLSWSGEGGKSGEGVKKGDIGNAIKVGYRNRDTAGWFLRPVCVAPRAQFFLGAKDFFSLDSCTQLR